MEPIGRFSHVQVDSLMRIWWRASKQLGADCPVPMTRATGEGALLFAWDNGRRYIDVEATPQGGFYWYFRDRETGEVQGTSDESVTDPGVDFFEKLTAVVTGRLT